MKIGIYSTFSCKYANIFCTDFCFQTRSIFYNVLCKLSEGGELNRDKNKMKIFVFIDLFWAQGFVDNGYLMLRYLGLDPTLIRPNSHPTSKYKEC